MCELKGPKHWPGCWREHHACALEFIEVNLVFQRAYLRWAQAAEGTPAEGRAFMAMVDAFDDVQRVKGEP